MNTTTKTGVVGAGTMGVGICITAARAGHGVVLCDVDGERVERGYEQVRAFLDKSVERGKLDAAARDRAMRSVEVATTLEALHDRDVVIEAIYEDLGAKQELLGKLDEICSEDALFHTNTSTLSVTEIAAGSRLPGRVVGTHYCNPAPLMRLVEVVRGQRTADDAWERTLGYVESIDKVAVRCADTPGFIVNYFLVPFENDCIRALEAGIGTVESIDRAVELGLGYPMGTFRLLDIVGLDVHKAVSTSLYESLKDPRFAAPPLVDRMIAAGQLGRKTGEGFYGYEGRGLHGT